MLMSWDIFTFIKPRGAKGQVLSCREEFEKSVAQNFESIVSHTKCRKSKSATTRIVIEKVWKRKRFPDQVGWVGFWQKKCLASNRSWEGERGDKELPSALLLVRKGRAWSPTPSSAAAALQGFVCPLTPRFFQRLSLKYEYCKNYIFWTVGHLFNV